jgi:hypothetical protein
MNSLAVAQHDPAARAEADFDRVRRKALEHLEQALDTIADDARLSDTPAERAAASRLLKDICGVATPRAETASLRTVVVHLDLSDGGTTFRAEVATPPMTRTASADDVEDVEPREPEPPTLPPLNLGDVPAVADILATARPMAPLHFDDEP